MDSQQARNLLEQMRGAGTVWTWSLHPQSTDLNQAAHEAEIVGEQVATFIFRRILDAVEQGRMPTSVSIRVHVDNDTDPFTCPRCGAVSHHPEDKRQRYCGACHEFFAPCDATRVGGSQPTEPA